MQNVCMSNGGSDSTGYGSVEVEQRVPDASGRDVDSTGIVSLGGISRCDRKHVYKNNEYA